MVNASFGKAQRVRLKTDLGDVLIEVYPERAPHSAGAFLRIADSGRYADAKFFRSVRPENDQGSPPITVIQAGILDGKQHFPAISHENTAETGIAHKDGVLSLARGGLGTATASHFFICIGDQPGLDYGAPRNADSQGFAAFGKVLDGMDVVLRIHARPTLEDAPNPYMKGQIVADPVVIRALARDA